MRSIVAVTLGLVVLGTASLADAAGWSFRICREATEASTIKVWVATSEGGEKADPWLTWKSDDRKVDFNLPAALAKSEKVWFQLETVPEGGVFGACAMYDEAAVKYFHATNDVGETVPRTARDSSCPCAKKK
jgi:hypothetical protein